MREGGREEGRERRETDGGKEAREGGREERGGREGGRLWGEGRKKRSSTEFYISAKSLSEMKLIF